MQMCPECEDVSLRWLGRFYPVVKKKIKEQRSIITIITTSHLIHVLLTRLSGVDPRGNNGSGHCYSLINS